MAVTLAVDNIRTTVISPGAVATGLPNSVTAPEIAVRADSFARRRLRDQPAGGGRRQRDPVSTDAARAVKTEMGLTEPNPVSSPLSHS
jgi:hypothetical protein